MKEILQNKLLIIFLIFFVIVGFFCSAFYNTYASETITFEGENGASKEFIISDDTISRFPYILVLAVNERNNCGLYVSNTPFTVEQRFNGFIVYSEGFSSISGDSSNYTFPEDIELTLTSEAFQAFSDSLGGRIIYSNHNIFNTDGELVFQVAPLEMVELMKAIQPEEIPQQIIQIVMIILPIFLLIFGTLLVLYLLKSKNLLHL